MHIEDQFAWNKNRSDIAWVLCLIFIVVAAFGMAVKADEPPHVETIDVWTKADQETQMFMVGVSWKFNHLYPSLQDVRHTKNEVVALIDYYRYPAAPEIDVMMADAYDGAPDVPDVVPRVIDSRGINGTEAPGAKAFLKDNWVPLTISTLGTIWGVGTAVTGDADWFMQSRDRPERADLVIAIGPDGQKVQMTEEAFKALAATGKNWNIDAGGTGISAEEPPPPPEESSEEK